MNNAYKDLRVWRESFELCREVYRLVREFPKYETYGLSDQLRRASVSIVSNIAEGASRSNKEFKKFLRYSRGSINEVETQILLAHESGYINKEDLLDVTSQLDNIGKMLTGLHKSLK